MAYPSAPALLSHKKFREQKIAKHGSRSFCRSAPLSEHAQTFFLHNFACKVKKKLQQKSQPQRNGQISEVPSSLNGRTPWYFMNFSQP
jgi:hypothetical protein